MSKITQAFFVSYSTADTESLAAELGASLQPFDVIALHGDLGAGKTAFTRGLAAGWGSRSRVSSPTFTLVNVYERPSDDVLLYHLDTYRLGSEDEAETIGLDDILADHAVVIIEWAERVAGWLPADHLRISLRADGIDVDQRTIEIAATGSNSAERLNQLKWKDQTP